MCRKVDSKIKELSESEIEIEELERKLVDRFDIELEDAEDRVFALIQDGTLFEPFPGNVKKLRS